MAEILTTRVFALFKVLGMEKNEAKDSNKKLGDLIPYILQGENVVEVYNDTQFKSEEIKLKKPTDKSEWTKSNAEIFRVTGLPRWYVLIPHC